jgi:hypothetical protein
MTAWNFLKPMIVMLALLVVSITAGGCVRNTNPILKDDQVTANDALLGKWVSKDGKNFAELTAGENNRYKLAYINEDHKTGAFVVRFGKIGDNLVAELKADAIGHDLSGEYQSLLLPLYTMAVISKSSPQQLELTGMSVDWLKKNNQDHPDELEVLSIGGQDMIVNSSTEEFQKFLLRHWNDKQMLGEPTVWVHPGDPTTRP